MSFVDKVYGASLSANEQMFHDCVMNGVRRKPFFDALMKGAEGAGGNAGGTKKGAAVFKKKKKWRCARHICEDVYSLFK